MKLDQLHARGVAAQVHGELARDERLPGPGRTVENNLALIGEELDHLRERLPRHQELIRETCERIIGGGGLDPRFGRLDNRFTDILAEGLLLVVAPLVWRVAGRENVTDTSCVESVL